MLRQYGPQRGRFETLPNGRAVFVGTLPVGTVFRMVERLTREGRPVLRAYIVEAWLTRRIGAGRVRCDRDRWVPEDVFVAHGGHLAKVRSLSNGARRTMADHVIRRWVDLDPRHEWSSVPPAVPH